MIIPFKGLGAIGVNKDAPATELAPNVWTSAENMRFQAGAAEQFLGHAQVYGTPSVVPYHITPVSVSGDQYWLVAGATKLYTVTGTTWTNITRQTAAVDVDYTAVRNGWTSTILGGIPVFNNGNDAPQQWLLSGKATALSAWPASTTCAVMRAFGPFLIALDVTKPGGRYPYLVKWSTRADPGSVPSTWDETDATADAGEFDISEGYDYIIDGLTLRGSFLIYKRSSIWRVSEVGGVFIFNKQKALGTSGALSKNCIVEVDGYHVVLTHEDVIRHDGNSATSMLDSRARRHLFSSIDPTYYERAFVTKNPQYNEVWICYPSTGNSLCNRALVWNWKEDTIGFRDLPSINHAAPGPVNTDSTGDTWDTVDGTWASVTRTWANNSSSLDTSRLLMAADGTKLLCADETYAFDGTAVSSTLIRKCLPLGEPETMKTLTAVRPVITGTDGGTVSVYFGGANDPSDEPTFNSPVTYTIGGDSNVVYDFATYRYPAVKFVTGTATYWKLASCKYEFEEAGEF
jgi:hypothetical protein